MEMSVNEVYREIYGFWSSIYPIIAFHLIFYLILKWINFPLPKFSVYSLISNEEKKKKIKELIETFHLQNVLPILLIFMVVGYFALFNVVENTYSSVRSVIGVCKINTHGIAYEFNRIDAIKTINSEDSISGIFRDEQEESNLMSDPFVDNSEKQAYNIKKYIIKYNRWNNLMGLAELLMLAIIFLLLRKLRVKKSYLKIKKLKLIFVFFLFVSGFIFMRVKQEIFLTKIVENKIALIINNYTTISKDKEKLASFHIGQIRSKLNRETILLNLLIGKLSFKKEYFMDDSFLE